ncbi:MAG: hypothetical protein EZS28_015503 [Streblomastix strix]|uniref:non-specific serine/threonine protein kinase n=1 Tax=Streblomastix strix TaxID=222440 RepID=A0A5J4W2R1_9EUKA|nr:MAG: hypothetical protein EZS28_015503 [Streblomastix strix]
MTFKSDVWSLGVIIIEMITGSHPYAGISMDETVQNIKQNKMNQIPSTFHGDLKEMVLAMLTVDPNKRPSAEELLSSDLMEVQALVENQREQIIELKKQ